MASKRVRGFYQRSHAWYRDVAARAGDDDFMIGVYLVDPINGTDGEFSLEREPLLGEKVWFLRAFDDSWKVFGEFTDFFAMLAGLGDEPTAEQIRAGLVSIGIVDLTPEKQPGAVRR